MFITLSITMGVKSLKLKNKQTKKEESTWNE